QVASFRGRLGESGGTLLAALKLRDAIAEPVERLFNYARMRRDEDNTVARYQALDDRARALWTRVLEALSFYNPETLELGRDKVDTFLKETEGLQPYAHMLDDLFREAEHMLSDKEEDLLASSG